MALSNSTGEALPDVLCMDLRCRQTHVTYVTLHLRALRMQIIVVITRAAQTGVCISETDA